MPQQIDAFVQKLLSCEKEQDILAYIKNNLDTLRKYPVVQLDNAFGTLDISKHAIGALALLYAKTQQASAIDDILFCQQVGSIFGVATGEQLRLVSRLVASVSHFYVDLLTKRHDAISGIATISCLVDRFRKHSAELTSIHADLCQLCLAAGCFKPAHRYLEIDYTEINNEEGTLDAKYILLFYYYGGCIMAFDRQFDKSLMLFELCLTIPATAMSAIMIDAYKKLTLVSLIVTGKVDPPVDSLLPRYVKRHVQYYAQPYLDLAQAFQSETLSRLQNCIEKEFETFATDRNVGLVKEVKRSLIKRCIQNVTKTYLTVSIDEIAKMAGLASPARALVYLHEMVAAGDIAALIDEPTQSVTFMDNEKGSAADSKAMETVLNHLDRDMQYLVEVIKKVKTVDESLETHQQWLRKSVIVAGAGTD